MTYNNIYEYFKDDIHLLDYFGPLSKVENNADAALVIYLNLVQYSKEYKKRCRFKRFDIGYVFFIKPKWFWNKNKLVSFCLLPQSRTTEGVGLFWRKIKDYVGNHFTCCLYSKNTRAINFLLKGGMKIKKSNELVTLLSI